MSSDDANGDRGLSNFAKAFRNAGPLFGSGIQMAAAVALMFFFGRWLDEKWGTAPWLMLIGTMFGAAAALIQFIRTVGEISKKESQEKKKPTP